MAVKASAQITLNSVVDIKATYRYYLLQSSTLAKPAVPTTNPPSSAWDDTEPTYTSGSTNSLYYVDLTVFSDDKFSYSAVSLSTSYEAAKEAYNKANNAQNTADSVNTNLKNNYYTKTQTDAAITVKGDSIISTVSATYATKTEAVITPKITGNQTRLVRISNAIADSIENVKLYGKTTQFTTTGKNLFPKAAAGSISGNGITFTSNGDGSYTVKGTSTGAVVLQFPLEESVILREGMCVHMMNNVSVSALSFVYWYSDSTSSYWSLYTANRIGTPTANFGKTITQVGIQIASGNTVDVTFSPMFVYSSTATAFEPYTGGMASPNPDYPQALESVGASGSIDAIVAGKNLLNYEIVASYSGSAVTSTIDEDGYITLTNTTTSYTQYPQQTITGLKGKLYCTVEVASKTGSGSIYVGNASNDYSSVINSVGTKTFTKEVDGYFRFMVTIGSGASVKFRAIVSVDDNTDYEPYKELQTLTASTPNGLPGIPVSSGSNYTDENGQQWICDEIDFARGVYVQRIGQYTFTGNEVTQTYGSVNANGFCRMQILSGGAASAFKSVAICVPAVCDKYVADSANNIATFINGGGTGYKFGYLTNGQMVFSTASTTTNAFKTEIAGTVIQYQLATPIETALSAEELAAFADLTNEPGTVTVYSEAALEVELSGIASSSAVTDAQKTANEAQGRADEAVVTLTEMQTTIQQLSDSIAMLVRDGTGGSMLKQDANGLWFFDISGIEESISDTANDIGTLDGIVRDANGEIDVLKSTADALQQRTEYVRSYTDENDQPCLELGEGDSVFKVRITNTEIQFAEGSDVPAKLNRKMLVIEKAMVKDELQFGDDEVVGGVWIWKRRENGNLGLSWKTITVPTYSLTLKNIGNCRLDYVVDTTDFSSGYQQLQAGQTATISNIKNYVYCRSQVDWEEADSTFTNCTVEWVNRNCVIYPTGANAVANVYAYD